VSHAHNIQLPTNKLHAKAAQNQSWTAGQQTNGTTHLLQVLHQHLFKCLHCSKLPYLLLLAVLRCIHQVDNAGLAGSTKLNFVFTHYYIDANKDFVPEYYCYKPGASEECVPFTAADITMWTRAFIPCLQYAVGQGFDIAFTPHLGERGLLAEASRWSSQHHEIKDSGTHHQSFSKAAPGAAAGAAKSATKPELMHPWDVCQELIVISSPAAIIDCR
jgi:hypothetical protein